MFKSNLAANEKFATAPNRGIFRVYYRVETHVRLVAFLSQAIPLSAQVNYWLFQDFDEDMSFRKDCFYFLWKRKCTGY